jgi:hypothetical protein
MAYAMDDFYDHWVTHQARFEFMDPKLKLGLEDSEVEKSFVSQADPWEEAVDAVHATFPPAESRKMIQCFVELLRESCPTCSSGP